jgi:hypothetical protein
VSTWIYLRCEDHDPPLQADGESGQHLYDLPQVRADLLNRDALVAAWRDDLRPGRDHFRSNTIRFLVAHPRCHIRIWDEYGVEHSTEEEAP